MLGPEPVLATWRSVRHGHEVLSSAIRLLKSEGVTVKTVCYLLDASETEAPPPPIPGVRLVPVAIELPDPTDHEGIYTQLKATLLPRLASVHDLHINISPGTPAMHAVWLILHAGAAFPEGTTLWSTQLDSSASRQRIDRVRFPITSYLGELRRAGRHDPRLALYEPDCNSESRRAALERLHLYATVAGVPLLILGERGTGKTRLVETHVAMLKGRKGPVVTVPCGGLDSSLAESALFGHVKGAFTGATASRGGLLAEADGGILFLDEVQDLPRAVQRKLVRVLQDKHRRYRQVGGDQELTVDFDLVCASNQSADVLSETLDEDLFDRLAHLVVTVPPLRECRDDLQADWRRVWTELLIGDDLPPEPPWTASLQEVLEGHPLPGNLRDLIRLAVLVMAWTAKCQEEVAIERAIDDWRNRDSANPAETGLFDGSRDERVQMFKAKLASWAKNRWGTWPAAARALSCDPKTLRDDLKRSDTSDS